MHSPWVSTRRAGAASVLGLARVPWPGGRGEQGQPRADPGQNMLVSDFGVTSPS